MLSRRFSAASSASARCSQNIEAAGTPDPSKASGRCVPNRGCQRQLTGVKIVAKKKPGGQPSLFLCLLQAKQIYLLSAVATSTAQATVQPTIGLLPIPRNPIISTYAKEEKPVGLNRANLWKAYQFLLSSISCIMLFRSLHIPASSIIWIKALMISSRSSVSINCDLLLSLLNPST